MIRYLRSDATRLSSEDIQDIIKAKNSMKRASEAMANKYKISIRRQADPVECNVVLGNKVKKTGGKKTKSKSVHISESPVIQTPLASISSKSLNISNEELGAFYEKEDKRGEKVTEGINRILAM
ncbi:unnamed protein product [Rhizophagus irregularis]|nr:unnamed protein product [Rhizophagus irregularis]